MRLTSLFILMSCALCAAADDLPGLVMTSTGPTYTVDYSFTTACAPETLYAVLHDYDQILKYLTKSNLTIEQLGAGPGWNRLRYTYDYLVHYLTLTFIRHRLPQDGRVVFSVEQCVSSSRFIPTVRSLEGWYELAGEARGRTRVIYHQKTTLDRELNRFYMFFIRRDTKAFLVMLEEYVGKRE